MQVHPGDCLAHWQANPQAYFTDVQARGALFDEESRGTFAGWGWFLFGTYALVGIVSGALTASAAVTRGHSPIGWFFGGLIFNVAAWIVLHARAPGDLSGLPAGPPVGWGKVPTTRAPVACPGCGAANPPASSRCAGCSAGLPPVSTPEPPRP